MNINRSKIILKPDFTRVLLRPFFPGDDQRALTIVNRIKTLSDEKTKSELKQIFDLFENRHKDLQERFVNRGEQIIQQLSLNEQLNVEKQQLIGAYFCHEYSTEAAALFNPSVVRMPEKNRNNANKSEIVISLRATGEGHISSITFRTGKISKSGQLIIDTPAKILMAPNYYWDPHRNRNEYDFTFAKDSDLSSRIIFPFSHDESNGIEDARFVQFTNDDGSKTYYATYTAYDGKMIRQKLLHTDDFLKFQVRLLQGSEVKNKGMALFPRKIENKFVMLSRQDNENNFIMFSDNLYLWEKKRLLLEPAFPWEFVQLGNCGSPIETEAGWLVLSHGVGSIRKYVMGAFLLDTNNPAKVIGRLKEPLLSPDEKEREGYVPNVIYSCGSYVHNNNLIIPYAMSDFCSTFATVNLDQLLEELTS